MGAKTILSEILAWAAELNLRAAVKQNIHFVGFYSAEVQAAETLKRIYYATLKEFGSGSKGSLPTQAVILEQAQRLSSPSKEDIAELVGESEEPHISSSLYYYIGTHGPNAHQSLTLDHWADDLSAAPGNGMRGNSASDGHLELYYLFKEGEQDRVASCGRLVTRPKVAAVLTEMGRIRSRF